jgi:hypothetical protein
MGIARLSGSREYAMKDSSSKDTSSDRNLSRRQTHEDAQAPRNAEVPGADDDSSVAQSMVSALGAPVEGALDSVRERERFANQGRDLGPDQVGGISGQRAADIPNVGGHPKKEKEPLCSDDARLEPTDTADDPVSNGRR